MTNFEHPQKYLLNRCSTLSRSAVSLSASQSFDQTEKFHFDAFRWLRIYDFIDTSAIISLCAMHILCSFNEN
jgi:hypothetical protein